MKKILLFASALALITSCSQEEFGTGNEAPKLKEGISFKAEVGTGAETKAQWEYNDVTKKWGMFWYAEADKMDIYVQNAQIGTASTSGTATSKVGENWDATNDKAVYKATRSENTGYFTADVNDKIIFPVKNADPTKGYLAPSFAYVYPSRTAVAASGKELTATLPALADQQQKEVNGSSIVKNSFMVGTKTATEEIKDYTSASDLLVDIKIERKMPLIGFFFKNYDANLMGNLISIEMEALGAVKEDGTVDATKKSNIDYGTDAKWNITKGEYTIGTTSTAQKVSLYLGATLEKDLTANLTGKGLEWGNGRDFTAFMTVAPVKRTLANFPKGEKIKVTYNFANTSIVQEFVSSSDWETGHTFYTPCGTDGLDLQDAPYMVLGRTANKKTLYIKKWDAEGKFGTKYTTVKDLIEKVESTPAADYQTIVSDVVLSKDDLGYLGANCTNMVAATLKANTEIPAFDIKAQRLTSLIAPLVNKIDPLAFNATDGGKVVLKTCILPNFKFENVAVASALLKASELEVADISSVDVISTDFPKEGLDLADFAKLKTITVKSGVKLGTKAFSGCSALTTVFFPEGVVGASVNMTGRYAFENCEALTAITVSNTVIPEGAFTGCTVLGAINGANGMAIVPTTIGASAFTGTAIADIDLSKTTTIGANAFSGCKELQGTEDKTKGIWVLNVDMITVLESGVFGNCPKLKYVGFKNVTEIKDAPFSIANTTTTECIEIKFFKEFAYNAKDAMQAKSFGNDITSTTLFVASTQKGVSNKTLTVTGTVASATPQTFTFKAIK